MSRDLPILFSAPMVRALLAGNKTQTRRVLKLPTNDGSLCIEYGRPYRQEKDGVYRPIKPLFAVGDRLWVREAWRAANFSDGHTPKQLVAIQRNIGDIKTQIHFEADRSLHWRGPREKSKDRVCRKFFGRLRASMYLPRAFSRLTLTVTAARVMRLQDVSEEDARAEGVAEPYLGDGDPPFEEQAVMVSCRMQFRNLWNLINGAGTWDANPWVAAYSFGIRKGNIDE